MVYITTYSVRAGDICQLFAAQCRHHRLKGEYFSIVFFFFLVLNLFVAIVDFVLLTHFSLVGDKLFFRISVELNILWSPFLFTTAVFSLFIKFRVGLGDAG